MVTGIASEWVTAINSKSVTAFIVIRINRSPAGMPCFASP